MLCVTALAHAIPGQPGTLDTTWALANPYGDGKRVTSIGTDDAAYGVAVQPDGKVVVAGTCRLGNKNEFCLARYSSSGTLDNTFGTGGIVHTDVGVSGSNAAGLRLQPDGKIVVAGVCYAASGLADVCLARYTTVGALDTSFGSGGKVLTSLVSSHDIANALALQIDGKIVLAGTCSSSVPDDVCLVRYLSDGALDATFGSAGKVITPIGSHHDRAWAVALLGDNKIVVAGGCLVVGSQFCLARFDTNGALDSAFGSGGKVIVAIGSEQDEVRAIAVQPDGNVVVAGQCVVSGVFHFCLARFNPSGALDTTFGTGGSVIADLSSTGDDYAYALALQPDGKMVVAGGCWNGNTNEFCLARYLPGGLLDATFGSSGRVATTVGGSATANALALQTDGKIVVAGQCWGDSDNDVCVARYDGDAPLNCPPDFDGDGVVDATNDALILARMSLGLTGNAVVAGLSFAPQATRKTWPLIRDYYATQCAPVQTQRCRPDFDGDGLVLATTDALILARARLGLTGPAVMNGITTNGVRNTWPLVFDYLLNQCGVTFPP
ncbi:MAG: hypothetical protein JNL19_03630 [Burkholderiales bacterium]|nr:hypothetical protein [Burkholderiales bacterium]